MQPPALPGLEAAPPARRRGRPPGSTNLREADLLKYLVAKFDGLTPGQQLAIVGLASAKEVRKAKPLARELGVDPVVAALILKARKLATALECKPAEAWALLAAARADLMPYVHQRRPQAVDVTSQGEKILPMIVGLPTVAPVVRMGGDVIEGEVRELQRLNEMEPVEVAQPKSHDDDESLTP